MELNKDMTIQDIMQRATSIKFQYEDLCSEDLSSFKVSFNAEEMVLESPLHDQEFRVPLSFIEEELSIEDGYFKFGPFSVK